MQPAKVGRSQQIKKTLPITHRARAVKINTAGEVLAFFESRMIHWAFP